MEARDRSTLAPRVPIPLVEIGGQGALALVRAEPRRMADILEKAADHYTGPIMAMADRLSEYWLARNDNPYLDEIFAVADYVNCPGPWMLNLSYEWSCTAAIGPDLHRGGNRLLRTLDWPLQGLGRNVIIARMEGEEGLYDAVTWPGFSGVLTAMAPGRFSAAINQPPMRRWSGLYGLDWIINRALMWREDSLPPVHLLRQVFDQCRDFDEAFEVLTNTPIAMPAFFTLSGVGLRENALIERTAVDVSSQIGPNAISNHWKNLNIPAYIRGVDSPGRLAQMDSLRYDTANNFGWVTPPILNPITRLSVIANAAAGHLEVLGWEQKPGADPDDLPVPVTQVYDGYCPV